MADFKWLRINSAFRAGGRIAAAVVLVAGLSACSILSGSGPTRGAILDGGQQPDGQRSYELIDLSADTIVPYLQGARPTLASHVSSMEAPTVRLVPGDTLRIMFAQLAQGDSALFAPLSSGGTLLEGIRVDGKGVISLPYVGRVKVEGLTVGETEDLLRKRLREQVVDPQVLVELVGDWSGSVLVAGAVKTPGRIGGRDGPLTILDAVNRAGGPALPAHEINVVVRNGQTARVIPYDEVLAGKNEPLPPRSEIVLEPSLKQFVAMGALTSPGLHSLPMRNANLLQALGIAGGLNDKAADATGVFVFRLAKDESGAAQQALVFRLNMRQPESIFLAKEFGVQPDDVIYVSNAPMYEWQKIITPIVQVLILGQRVDGF